MEVDSNKYLSIREASVAYQVSRTKIHRLVKNGVIRAANDPRDDRITLVSIEDLDTRFHGENVMEIGSTASVVGIATTNKLDRMNAIRETTTTYGVGSDSTEMLREEREIRSGELDRRSTSVEDANQEDGR
jgi:hypothetical protein